MTSENTSDKDQSKALNKTDVMVSAGFKNRNPFRIICVKEYEFEGRIFKVGEIGYSSFGRNIPNNWEKLKTNIYEK